MTFIAQMRCLPNRCKGLQFILKPEETVGSRGNLLPLCTPKRPRGLSNSDDPERSGVGAEHFGLRGY